jgi:hypothetical protein
MDNPAVQEVIRLRKLILNWWEGGDNEEFALAKEGAKLSAIRDGDESDTLDQLV